MTLIHFAILLPVIAAAGIGILYRYYKKIHLGWFVLPIPTVITIYLFTLMPAVSNNQVVHETLDFMPRVGMNFDVYIDGLSLLFAILISGIGALVVLYSIGYLSQKEKLGNFYVYLLIFMTAMLGVVLNDNVLMLYLFWELTSISSFLLIAYWFNRERSIYGAQKSLLITMFGGFLMLGGFIALGQITDTYSIRGMMAQIPAVQESALAPLAIILILIGAFTKSAQFPFYIWLPDAMEAPTPVSAYLHSATMVKAGLYLVARFTPLFAFAELWVWSIIAAGLVTLVWAAFNAIKQDDLKAVLAFSTVSQLGLIMSLLGIGALAVQTGAAEQVFTIATVAAVFHLINHATFKGALFMIIGIVDHETGTRSLKKLGGLVTIMPISFTMTLIASLSMAGIPPFNGFLSKEMFLEAMFAIGQADFSVLADAAVLFPLLAIIGSIFTFIYSIMLIRGIFLGKKMPATPKTPKEAPALMLIAPAFLTLLVVVFGLFPNVLSGSIIDPAAMSILNISEPLNTEIHHWHGWDSPALWATVAIIAIGTLMYIFRDAWRPVYRLGSDAFTLNHLYDQGLIYSRLGAEKITDGYMSGYIRSYLIYIFGAFVIFSLITLINTDISFDWGTTAPIALPDLLIVLIILAAVAAILITRSRMVSIIMFSTIGFALSLLFVFFRSVDLALTQLAVEAITTALFLLAFFHLPKRSGNAEPRGFKLNNLMISAAVGIIATVIGLAAYSNRLFDSISQFYIDNVYDLAAGGNMVNVILVDFRSLDTLFETLVFAIAGLGVFVLLKLRVNKEGENKFEEHP
ncbi:Na+/H+ antiporter subunit A [Lacicoccus alkaliphilus]|uniref:Multicomponent Na+:H+ antiporter subunit A n=1 Tax=Lacicoccus alkaliphilus DSM 16010 TaxID=1123231 RepID=A0A1M7FL94_9BACL|nr:Na+/H+ antiporter subunit A [Salinicoccus alkaliphilus]SHM04459.1 multicomponent Na+:H+ antiporter subunit A [Salinicoccus alkaliphilus DSM 16010]